jgi:hypothetical protein
MEWLSLHAIHPLSVYWVATVRNAPVIACAPTLFILFIRAMPLDPQACIYTLEA